MDCIYIIILFSGMVLGAVIDRLILNTDFEKFKKTNSKDKNEW